MNVCRPSPVWRDAVLWPPVCLVLAGAAQAQTTYNVAGLADFTGPFADVMKDMTGCRKGVLDWWSDEVGKAQGVALRVKEYDTRATTWRRWPVCGPASSQNWTPWPFWVSAARMRRPCSSDYPMTRCLRSLRPPVMASRGRATAGCSTPRATYPHEAAAFYTWLQKKSGSSAPIKVGVISSEVSPAYVDIHKGIEKFAKDNPKILEVVETVYTEAQPTDLTQQVNRLIRKGATVLQVFNNTASVVATRRALQSLGKTNIPIVMSAHNGLISSGKALGGLEQMEGNYEVYGMAMPTEDPTTARAFFEKLRTKYKAQVSYTSACIMGMSQGPYRGQSLRAGGQDQGLSRTSRGKTSGRRCCRRRCRANAASVCCPISNIAKTRRSPPKAWQSTSVLLKRAITSSLSRASPCLC